MHLHLKTAKQEDERHMEDGARLSHGASTASGSTEPSVQKAKGRDHGHLEKPFPNKVLESGRG